MIDFRRQLKNISIALVVGWCSLPVFASDDDHDTVRKLRDAGDVLSLETILERIKPTVSGKLLEVEVESEHGSHIYELEILDENGLVWELKVDAKTAQILKKKKDD
jgi:uncharacterized membrane protein YkoI